MGRVPENLAIPIPRNLKIPIGKRDRKLRNDELERFMCALALYPGNPKMDPGTLRLIVLLALMTAQRKGNILSMRWDEIDNHNHIWAIPKEKTKTRKLYINPLHDEVWGLLQLQKRLLMKQGLSGSWVFPNLINPEDHIVEIKRPWKWLMKEAELEDFRFHDLRHTAASLSYEETKDPVGTQHFLQHADSSTTVDRYIHSDELKAQKESSDAVVKALFNSTGLNSKDLKEMVYGDSQAS